MAAAGRAQPSPAPPGGSPGPEDPAVPEEPELVPVPGSPAAAAGGVGEEAAAARGRDVAAGEAPPAAPAEEESEEERRERAALLEQLGGLADERERLRQASTRLQMQLGRLLRRRRAETETAADGPMAYGQRLLRLRELRELREREAAAGRERVAAQRRSGEERQARAQAEWAAFQARKKAVAVSSLGRRPGGGGEAAAAAVVDRIQAREREKEQRVREARVENIKLKHEIQNLETSLKAQGERVEGQHLMDLEHMKKENQKHSEKIDILSNEVLKLKKKVSNAVHILSQFREKLQFVEAENQGRKAELMDIETTLAQKRDILTRTKQARDRLRRNNLKLQQNQGLLGNEILLRDFEEKVDTIELLSQRLETLKCHHAGLILTCRGIQEKIKEANSPFLPEDDWRKEGMRKK
ncbi:coiled-coil domain-containing protein 96 [Phalacrocorax carbo]|uniref:coiled-coil domain-containing protein 96 n=1 Tax=Phalacrocorax carbo TaxID=9209 RepID=UPI003119D022